MFVVKIKWIKGYKALGVRGSLDNTGFINLPFSFLEIQAHSMINNVLQSLLVRKQLPMHTAFIYIPCVQEWNIA